MQFTVTTPATSANLGPGFDSLGMALACVNRFHVTVMPNAPTPFAFSLHPGTCIETAGLLDAPYTDNLVWQSMQRLAQHVGVSLPPVAIDFEGHIPLSRGMGSSSSAIVAGLLIANTLMAESGAIPVEEATLLALANAIEGHPDNVAPALLGGVCLCEADPVTDTTPLPPVHVTRLPWPTDWQPLVIVPPYPLATHKARSALPKAIPVADVVFTLRKLGQLVSACHTGDSTLLRAALHDAVHQPYRIPLITDFEVIRTSVLSARAYGMVISGAGPSMLCLAPPEARSAIETALAGWTNQGYRLLWLKVSHTGASVTLTPI